MDDFKFLLTDVETVHHRQRLAKLLAAKSGRPEWVIDQGLYDMVTWEEDSFLLKLDKYLKIKETSYATTPSGQP